MSKTVRTRRTGARHGDRVGGAAPAPREGAQASAGRRSRENTASGAARADAGYIPSTLDPDLELETDDIGEEIEEREHEAHTAQDEESPEEEIADEVMHAAEDLPAEVPADKADHTDQREEHPPRLPR